MREAFEALFVHLEARLRGGEVLLAAFHGERSAFARVSGGRVRQPGEVEQREVELRLIARRRHASVALTLAGDAAEDRARAEAALAALRETLPGLPEDPHLLYCEEGGERARAAPGDIPAGEALLAAFLDAAGDLDVTGILAAGPVYRGFASSHGRRRWFESGTFNLDWSVTLEADRAVKCGHAGARFEPEALRRKMEAARDALTVLGRPPRTIPPGEVRTYLAPAAVAELLGLLAWGGFGLRARETGQTPLLRLARGDERLHRRVTIVEDIAGGGAPFFDALGFDRPDAVTLIRAGRMGDPLVSPRSAREYGARTTGAGEGESPESLHLAPGDLPEAEAMAALDTGVHLSNAWYLNYSDRTACRVTGMTRFATLWVEGGRPVAPLAPMRFDDTLARMLGERLEALTDRAELFPDTDTYHRRALGGTRCPGALLAGLRFTL